MADRPTKVTIVEKEAHKLLQGEVTYSARHQTWFIGCPGESLDPAAIGSLAGHGVAYDEAVGLLTVSPSILCLRCGSHYFVERNQIRWV